MPFKYPGRQKRVQAITKLFRQYPQTWFCQAEIARQLKYPPKMVMKDLIHLEDMNVLICDDGNGLYQLMENAWR